MASSTYWLTRFYFQRALGAIYLVGFLIAFNQFKALCGRNGLLPFFLYLKDLKFWNAPSLFWLNQSDHFIVILTVIGLILSLSATLGYSDAFGPIVSVTVWFLLWVIYLSFVNVGQVFYGFGWETLLLEAGFLAIFLGPTASKPSVIMIYLLRWLLFRLMFGAGLIKIQGDDCWRDLSCMRYHYETMPLPGPTSWYFHHTPEWVGKASVLFNHFVELVVPFFYFAPRPFRHTAGILTILFQLTIIASGNFSWLNHITIVIALACFDDTFLPQLTAWTKTMGMAAAESASGFVLGVPFPALCALSAIIIFLSLNPIRNLFSRRQMMNASFEPLHLVNTYGAFGSITKVRTEIIVEGSNSPDGPWQQYEFKGKPGGVSKMPPLVSPYHFKLDWQMWFAAMGPYYRQPWFINLMAKILQGQKDVLSLMGENPFPKMPPKYVRALLYEYHYSNPEERNWWRRDFLELYFPIVSIDEPKFRAVLESQGWLSE